MTDRTHLGGVGRDLVETLHRLGERYLNYRERYPEIPFGGNWEGLCLSNFIQETEPVDLGDGVIHEPSFDWHAVITGRRRKDGVDFYTKLIVPAKVKPVAAVDFLASRLRDFNEFTDCACQVGAPCRAHDTGIGGSNRDADR